MQPWLCDFAKAAYPLCVSVSTCHKNEHGGETQPHVGDCFTFKENQYTKDHDEIPVCVGTSPCATARSRADVQGSWGLTCQWVRIPMRVLCSHTQSGASWKVQVQRTCEPWGFVSLRHSEGHSTQGQLIKFLCFSEFHFLNYRLPPL